MNVFCGVSVSGADYVGGIVGGIVSMSGDEETTGIRSVSKESGSEGIATDWYTVDGRRLSGKPVRNGLYIVNGKKIIIK